MSERLRIFTQHLPARQARRLAAAPSAETLRLVLPFERRQKAGSARIWPPARRSAFSCRAARCCAAATSCALPTARCSRSSRRASRFPPSGAATYAASRRSRTTWATATSPSRSARVGSATSPTTCSMRMVAQLGLTVDASRRAVRARERRVRRPRPRAWRTVARTAIRTPHEHALPRQRGVAFQRRCGTRTTTSMNASTFKLWQLISPALPVGAYSYSQALEQVHFAGIVHDEHFGARLAARRARTSASRRLDLPILLRVHRAWADRDAAAVRRWSRALEARRETAELRFEDLAMGSALAQLLTNLGRGRPGARGCRSRAPSPSRPSTGLIPIPKTPAPAMPGPGAKRRSRPP